MRMRVFNMINFRNPMDYYSVENVEDALKLIDDLAHAQLKNPSITDNMFGLDVYNEDEKEWENWCDEDGYGIEDYELAEGKAKMTKWA